MHFECDNKQNAATWRYIKTTEFYFYQSDKGICHCGIHEEEWYNQQQSFTTASKKGQIVLVKVLTLKYKNML